MFLVEFGRNALDGEDDEERNDDQVVELPQNGNEIGDEVKGQEGISNGCPQEPARTFGGAWVLVEALEDVEILFEKLTCLNEFFFDHGILKRCPNGWRFVLEDYVYVNELLNFAQLFQPGTKTGQGNDNANNHNNGNTGLQTNGQGGAQ